jgi:hypothetical protein
MDVIKVATNYCNEKISEYPQLTDQIRGFYDLFRMEIEDDCCNWDNEWELLWQDVKDLIEEHNNEGADTPS